MENEKDLRNIIGKMTVLSQIICFLKIPATFWYLYFRGNIRRFLSKGKIKEVLDLYDDIHSSPLYTRNGQMEIRTMIVIGMLNANLFRYQEENKDFVNIAFLLTLIDCLADALADELNSKGVDKFLMGHTGTGKIEYVQKMLEKMRMSTKGAIHGDSRKESLNDERFIAIMATLTNCILELISNYEDIQEAYNKLLPTFDWAVDYMFASHIYSLSLKRKYNNFSKGVELLSVNDHLYNVAGGTNYALVFAMILLGKWRSPDAKVIMEDPKLLVTLMDISREFSEIHALGNGFKSYKREYIEGDFSSWVWNYLATLQEWDNIRSTIHMQISANNFNKSNIKTVLESIPEMKLQEFFILEYKRRYEDILKKSYGILPKSYVTLLGIILRLELRSGGKEEREQMEAFQSNAE